MSSKIKQSTRESEQNFRLYRWPVDVYGNLQLLYGNDYFFIDTESSKIEEDRNLTFGTLADNHWMRTSRLEISLLGPQYEKNADTVRAKFKRLWSNR